MAGVLVRDVMSRTLISVDSQTTLFQVAKMMEQGIGAVIVKRDGTPSGIITDRDYAVRVAVNGIPTDRPVEQAATFPLITIPGGEALKGAAAMMAEKGIRKLAVVDEGKIVGIITSTDLVKHMSE